MKLRHILQLTVRRILPAAVLILICIATALFAGGYYTFSFLQGENNILPPSFFSPLGDVYTEDAGDTLAPGDKEKPIDIVLPDDMTPQNATTREEIAALSRKISFPLPTAMTLMSEGFSRSTEDFTRHTTLFALAGGFDFTPMKFSEFKDYRQTVRYEQPYQFAEVIKEKEKEQELLIYIR